MKANLTLHQNAFAQPFPLGGKLPDFATLAGRIAAGAATVFARVSRAFHSVSAEEAYLARSQNIAELERRMLELQSRDSLFTSAYW